jgi:hypothetical protein
MNKALISDRKGGVKAPSFLTGFTLLYKGMRKNQEENQKNILDLRF